MTWTKMMRQCLHRATASESVGASCIAVSLLVPHHRPPLPATVSDGGGSSSTASTVWSSNADYGRDGPRATASAMLDDTSRATDASVPTQAQGIGGVALDTTGDASYPTHMAVPSGGTASASASGADYAWCITMRDQHGVVPQRSWGTMPDEGRAAWQEKACDDHLLAATRRHDRHRRRRRHLALHSPMSQSGRSIAGGGGDSSGGGGLRHTQAASARCERMRIRYGVRPGTSWGTLSIAGQVEWGRLNWTRRIHYSIRSGVSRQTICVSMRLVCARRSRRVLRHDASRLRQQALPRGRLWLAYASARQAGTRKQQRWGS